MAAKWGKVDNTTFDNEISINSNCIEFSTESIFIEDVNKQTVYRFNKGTLSPFAEELFNSRVEWDYKSSSARCKTSNGIYGFLPNNTHRALIHLDPVLRACINSNNDVVFLKLEVDKLKLQYNQIEVTFHECNIIEILTFEDFVIREAPQFYDFFESFKIAKENPTKLNIQEYERIMEKVYLEAYNPNVLQKTYVMFNGVHGMEHSLNVMVNGVLLSLLNGANLKVITLFAVNHDIRRFDDHTDPEHGKRAAILLRALRRNNKIELEESEFEELCCACENHTAQTKSGNITIDTCYDADRLDLTRIGIAPDPNRMATQLGRYFAQNMPIFNELKQQLIANSIPTGPENINFVQQSAIENIYQQL